MCPRLFYVSELICNFDDFATFDCTTLVNIEACGIQCACTPDDNACAHAYTQAPVEGKCTH